MRQRVGIFRARAAGGETAAAFARLGFMAVQAPVIELVALACAPPPRDFALVVAASAPAFAFAGPWLARLDATPLALVGETTLGAARAAGLRGPAQTFADAAALARAAATLPPGEILYLAGRDRKSTIESGFAAANRPCTLLTPYEARARLSWSDEEIAALSDCGTFVHYSRRSASLAIALARSHGLVDVFARADHVCLSDDVAAPLREEGWGSISVAQEPNGRALEAAPLQR